MRDSLTDRQKRDILETARLLRSEDGENPEYDRALVELTSDLLGFTQDDREMMQRLVLSNESIPDAQEQELLMNAERDIDYAVTLSAIQSRASTAGRWLPQLRGLIKTTEHDRVRTEARELLKRLLVELLECDPDMADQVIARMGRP